MPYKFSCEHNDGTLSCSNCGVLINADGSNFPTRPYNGKRYYRHLCRKCHNAKSRARYKQTISYRAAYQRKALRQRRKRSGWLVLSDYRKSDKKHGLVCDLTAAEVDAMLLAGCTYCGASQVEVTMGLDRKDNAIGHTKQNVVPCCTRCNLTRSSMPYEAWLVVAGGMRVAREQNLFGSWVPGCRHRPPKT